MNYTRIAVVGCGFYAQNHLNAWNDLKDKGAKLVSVCDLDHKKAKVAGEKFGVPFYTNICLLYTSPSPRDISGSRMPSSA